MWVAMAQSFAVFGIFANRSRESLFALVGDYQGIILNTAKIYKFKTCDWGYCSQPLFAVP